MQPDGVSPRTNRELKTVWCMIALFCRKQHHAYRAPVPKGLCPECRDLWEYTRKRVERCPFAYDKPTCLRCTVHCFKPHRREQIRTVMRFSGPKMLWHHPILTFFHLLDGRRKPPDEY